MNEKLFNLNSNETLFADSLAVSFDVFQFIDQRLEFLLVAEQLLNRLRLARLVVERLQIDFEFELVRWIRLLDFH